MSLTVPTAMLATGLWTSATTTPTITSVLPTAGALMVYLGHWGNGDIGTVASITDDIGDTGGTAWAEHVNVEGPSPASRMVIFSRLVGTDPSSGTVTLTLDDNVNRGSHGVLEYLGQHATPTSETDSATADVDNAIELDGITLEAGNSIVCCAGTRSLSTIVAGDNTSIIVQVNSGDVGRSIAFSTATGNPNWSNLDGTASAAAAVEIVVAAAVLTPVVMHQVQPQPVQMPTQIIAY